MTSMAYEGLTYYATPPSNYIGTFIFLSYIVAALYATITITYSLYTQYITLPHPYAAPKTQLNSAKDARRRHIQIYALLASVSFATLSYNMLMFLVTHYTSWSGDKMPSIRNVTGSGLGRWMLDSALFQDFAQDLVQDAPSAVWTQSAIVATWFWNIWMAQKARQRTVSASMMRTFVLLSQILPISLTASLFIMQLHLSAPEFQDPKHADAPPVQRKKPLASLQIPNLLLNAALLALPALRGNSIFSLLVLFERFVLLLPHFGVVGLRDAEIAKCITVSGGFLVANAVRMRGELTVSAVLGILGEGGYAVKALAWDAVLGALVYVVLGWGGGV